MRPFDIALEMVGLLVLWDRAYVLDLFEACGVTEIDDQQRRVHRLQRAREPRDRVLGRVGRKVNELQGEIFVGRHAGLGKIGRAHV